MVWIGSATRQERNKLQWTVRAAEKLTGADLPSILDLGPFKSAGYSSTGLDSTLLTMGGKEEEEPSRAVARGGRMVYASICCT